MSLNRGGLFGLGLAAGALFLSTSASAGVVVSSSGPSARNYPVGKKIGSDETITLRTGDTLTVLDGGGTRILRGAGAYTLASGSTAAGNDAFDALIRQRTARRGRVGAVRNDDRPATIPNLWYVDVTRSGRICLRDAGNLRLWRAETAEPAMLTIAGGGRAGDTAFRANEMLATWSEAVPLSENTEYTLAGAGLPTRTRITFHFLGEAADEPEALAEQLIAAGCMTQLEQMSSAMLREEEGSA